MSKRTQNSAPARGFTMIESLITMVVLIIAFLGFASLQLVGVQANYFGDRLLQASQLATDLAENIQRWPYTDPRLTPTSTLLGPTAISDPSITGNWDLGTSLTTTSKAQYSDLANDPNATNPGALGSNYQGLSSDVDNDGVPDFTRYWNVYSIDLANSGTPNGLLVQIVVRWKQPGFGYRQVTTTAFKINPAGIFR